MFKSPLVFIICLTALAISGTAAFPEQKLKDQSDPSQNSRIKKRSHSPWEMSARSNPISLYNAGNVYKPAPETISRLYYIPVYRVQGGNNPPLKRPTFQGPPYLPPKETPTQTEQLSMTDNRFGRYDDRPIWANKIGRMILSGDTNKESSLVPTRPPIPSNQDRQSLLHDTSSSQAKKPPGAFTRRHQTQPATKTPKSGPNNCVWAIISCCSPSNPSVIHLNCFEQRGCPGPFWDRSPCNSEYAKAAIDAVTKYYGKGGK